MKRILLLLVLASFTGVWTLAADITPEQAMNEARQFMMAKMQRQTGDQQAPAVAPQMALAGRVSELYVFNVASGNGGYVIVSNDDCAVPVLGYSESGALDVNNIPENMRAWLEGYAEEIAWAKAHPSQMAPAMHRAKSNVKTPIAPLMQTQWYQDAPYNSFCPKMPNGTRCVTGCLATAMAQCMYYTEMRAGYTTSYTTAEIPGYTSKQGSLEFDIEGIPAGTPIDWYKLALTYNSGDTDEAAVEVAKLMKICGVSVKMMYGGTSYAYPTDAAEALKNYFGYSNTVEFKQRPDYTYSDWVNMLYHELSLGRAVLYAGTKPSRDAHAFVCDGYQGEDFFHINWGWGGHNDDYFKLSALNPDSEGIGGSDAPGGYSLGQSAVVGIQKETENLGDVLQIEPFDFNSIKAGTMSIDKSEIVGGETVKVTVPILNDGDKSFDGQLLFYDDNKQETLAYTMVSVPAGSSKVCVIEFTPENTTRIYKLYLCYTYGKYAYSFDQLSPVELSVTKSDEVETTDNVELKRKSLSVENFERIGNKSVFYGNVLHVDLTLGNDTEQNYSGTIQFDLYDKEYNLVGRTAGQRFIPANGSLMLSVEAIDLTYGDKYLVAYTFIKDGSWHDWVTLGWVDCRPGIVVADGEGNKSCVKPTETFDVPENATSVDMRGCGVNTINRNGNPNTLYILNAGDNVPSGLTNVVKADAEGNYTAESITLTDGQNFLSPVNFTAQKVEFTYGNVTQCDEHIRWNTLMLPFEATTVTADGESIDWRHSSTDDNGRFWLKRFAGDEVDKVYLESEAGNSVEANVPYLFAMPVDLSSKTIKFVGENTTVKKADAVSPFTAESYSFVGSTCAISAENIYTLNDGGSAFLLGQGSNAFRAYFKPVTFNPAVTRLSIRTGETSGIQSMYNEPLGEHSETLATNGTQECTMNNEVYDLQGRRVTPTAKGVYIKNGRKVVVK